MRHEEPQLPHGPEFRFVDKVLSLRPGHSVVGCLELGAPGARPVFGETLPGSYLLESMIQTCGLLGAPLGTSSAGGRSPGRSRGAAPGMVVALDRVRWFGSPRNRGRVIVRCRVLRQIGAFLRCRCVARSQGGDLLARGEVTLRMGAENPA